MEKPSGSKGPRVIGSVEPEHGLSVVPKRCGSVAVAAAVLDHGVARDGSGDRSIGGAGEEAESDERAEKGFHWMSPEVES